MSKSSFMAFLAGGKGGPAKPVQKTEEAIAKLDEAIKDQEAKAKTDQAAAFNEAVDSEYWFCVCFKTREQKEEFLRVSGLAVLGGDKYLDGEEVAGVMKVKLAPVQLRKKSGRVNQRLADLVKR